MTPPQPIIRRINKVLGPHLVKKDLLPHRPTDAHPSWGCCYAATEALYYLWGKKHGFSPQYVVYAITPGIKTTHWFLRDKWGTTFVDPTGFQFDRNDVGLGRKIDYTLGVACGFLTKQPSKRAQQIMKAVA